MSWIKISEEKPEVEKAILIYLKNRGPLIGILMAVDKSPIYKWWAIFSTGAHPIDRPDLITHWQLLPEPPNE